MGDVHGVPEAVVALGVALAGWAALPRLAGRRSGHTFPELLAILGIMGVVASIAAPRMHGMIVRARVRGAMMVLRGDLSHARMLAVRSGHGAVVRFVPDPECVGAGAGPRGGRAYRIAARGPGGIERPATLRMLGGKVCYTMNGSDSLVFNSRGLLAPFNNRTIWAMEAGVRDSLTVSVAGRILHRPW